MGDRGTASIPIFYLLSSNSSLRPGGPLTMPFFGGGGASVDLASPSAIGSTTPNTGKFTTLEATTSLQVSTSGFLFGGTNILEQRNLTNVQAFRIYQTYTDQSNYGRVNLTFDSTYFQIDTRNGIAGTGTARGVELKIPNNTAFIVAGGFGGGELFGIRPSYMNTTYGVEIGSAGWRGATRCINLFSDRGISWANSTSSFTTADAGIIRNAAGVIEVNDGTTAGAFRDLIVRNFRMSAPTGVPATAGATGTEGSIRWDADYIYVCTTTNTWKRAAISTWP